MDFDGAFERLLGHEGGYSNHPADPGGETMWGITALVARAQGYLGPMKDMPIETAKAIYHKLYWSACHLDVMPEGIRFTLFDAAVNSGPRQAIKWLQRAVGAADDGVVGPQTLSLANQFDSTRLVCWFSGVRLQFMTDLPTWTTFGKGWARRIATNLREV